MDAAIISALIAAGAAILVCMINNHYQQEAVRKKHDETISLIDYRLQQLEKKVELHNNCVSRLYEVERQLGIDEEKIRSCKRRIDDLEHEKGRN
ncbi:MAG: hypothetical protein IKW21_01175 [Lachnospiraceae bacterium]|nr:hypothetical protein [Lachnospiraceae bacterium]